MAKMKREELVGKTFEVKDVQNDAILLVDVSTGYYGLSSPLFLIEASGEGSELQLYQFKPEKLA